MRGCQVSRRGESGSESLGVRQRELFVRQALPALRSPSWVLAERTLARPKSRCAALPSPAVVIKSCAPLTLHRSRAQKFFGFITILGGALLFTTNLERIMLKVTTSVVGPYVRART